MTKRVLLRDLQPGKLYHIQARVTNGDQWSQWSQLFDLQTVSDTLAPAPVTGLSWSVSGTAFVATWTGPTTNSDGSALMDFKDFEVKVYSSAAPATIRTFYTTAARFDFSFEDNLNAFGTPRASVTIEVKARDNTGNLSSVATATATNAAPANVTGLTVTGIVDGIALRWSPVADNDLKYYQVYEGTVSGSETNLVYQGLGTSFIYDTVTTFAHYFKVFAVDVFNTPSASGAAGNAIAKSSLSVDTTAPAAPTGVTVSSAVDTTDPSGARTYIDVSWSAVADTDLQFYSVRYSASSSGPWQYINVPEGVVTNRINGLRPGTAYYVAVNAVDWQGNASAYTNAGTYPITTAADTAAPSTPTAPTIAANALQIQVTHDGNKAAGGALESDLDHLDVYASTTTGFTPGATNLIGRIGNGPAKVASFPIPVSAGSGTTQTWYAKVIAVDAAGNRSTASAQSSASVPLIAASNIGDATITNAKIADLAADKITAGTGIINSLLVKAGLTVDTAGLIKSSNYAAGSAGYQLTNTTLEINQGSIAAAALLLQDSQNIVHPAYADWEHVSSWYTGKIGTSTPSGTATWAIALTAELTPKYSTQSFKMIRAGGSAGDDTDFWLGANSAAYNIPVEPNTVYICSAYVYNASGTKTFQLKARTNDGVFRSFTAMASAPGNAAWTRYSGTLNVGSNTALTLGFSTETDGTMYVDGLQLERQIAGSTTPSQWKPPSQTSIDGGIIRTGSIQSTASANGLGGQPAWSINVAGNAQFGDAAIRGRLVVGDISNPSADGVNSRIVSSNYASGSAGWTIRNDGFAEFNNILIRGGTSSQGQMFFYNSTPASGNMFMSLASASGTDSFSNAYLKGLTVYGTSQKTQLTDGLLSVISNTGSFSMWLTEIGLEMEDGVYYTKYNTSGAHYRVASESPSAKPGGVFFTPNGGVHQMSIESGNNNVNDNVWMRLTSANGSTRGTAVFGQSSIKVDVTTWGDLTANGIASFGNMRMGQVSITPTAGSPTPATVTYSTLPSSNTRGYATAQSSVVGTVVLGVGVSVPTTTSMIVYLTRTNGTTTTIYWQVWCD